MNAADANNSATPASEKKMGALARLFSSSDADARN